MNKGYDELPDGYCMTYRAAPLNKEDWTEEHIEQIAINSAIEDEYPETCVLSLIDQWKVCTMTEFHYYVHGALMFGGHDTLTSLELEWLRNVRRYL